MVRKEISDCRTGKMVNGFLRNPSYSSSWKSNQFNLICSTRAAADKIRGTHTRRRTPPFQVIIQEGERMNQSLLTKVISRLIHISYPTFQEVASPVNALPTRRGCRLASTRTTGGRLKHTIIPFSPHGYFLACLPLVLALHLICFIRDSL